MQAPVSSSQNGCSLSGVYCNCTHIKQGIQGNVFFSLSKTHLETTQLVVSRKRDSAAHLTRLSDIPVELTVLIDSEVCARPETARHCQSLPCCVLDMI